MIIDAHIHIFSRPMSNLTPAEYADGCFPAERLVALMDREGVSKAVILQNPTIGTINDEVASAVEKCPSRFAGVVQVDPQSPDAGATLRRFALNAGQVTIKLEVSEGWGWTGIHPGLRLSSKVFESIWSSVAELGLNVIIDPGPPGNAGYQVEEIDDLSCRLPQINFLLEHLGYLPKEGWDDGAVRTRRMELLRLALRPNVYLGFSATAVVLEEDWPCPRTAALLEEAVALAGAHKILWGSDAPYSLRRYSYRQMIDMVREHPKLSDSQRTLILGENAARLFFT